MPKTQTKQITKAIKVTVNVIKMSGVIDELEDTRVRIIVKLYKHVGFARNRSIAGLCAQRL